MTHALQIANVRQPLRRDAFHEDPTSNFPPALRTRHTTAFPTEEILYPTDTADAAQLEPVAAITYPASWNTSNSNPDPRGSLSRDVQIRRLEQELKVLRGKDSFSTASLDHGARLAPLEFCSRLGTPPATPPPASAPTIEFVNSGTASRKRDGASGSQIRAHVMRKVHQEREHARAKLGKPSILTPDGACICSRS